ncbi:MAG: hypothetical protein HY908_14125, partial [Myxococcales bacterium]|nr:hypothetical protein [Myxococcales bacterium]
MAHNTNRSVGCSWLAAAGALAALAVLALPREALAQDCSSFNPADWPAPSKPYFMIAFDTSGSMTTDVNPISNDSCGLGTRRLDHGRCALRNMLQAYSGQVNFGLATFARQMSNCAANCGGCTFANFPGNSGNTGCGPEPACGLPNSGCRAGANIVVPMQIDDYWNSPPTPSNVPSLLTWVDGSCAGSTELFASGNTPLNGILRDMFRYYQASWTRPGGAPTYATPLGTAAQGERPCRSVNVLLLTDGDETCDVDPADPVDAAADLLAGFAAGGINWSVRTHVINFAGGQISTSDAIAAAGGTGSSYFATNEVTLSQALSDIIAGAIQVEACNNGDDNCNGCVDEGYKHYADVSQPCYDCVVHAGYATEAACRAGQVA